MFHRWKYNQQTIKSVLCGFEYCVPSVCFPPLCYTAAVDASKQFNPNFQSDVIIPGYCCLCVTRTSGFSHMKQRGEAAGRDLTSAFMCAFGLVSGTKTWLADRALPGSAETRISDNNNQINHAHAAVSASMPPSCGLGRRGLGPLWSTGSGGYTELRGSQIGTVKLARGVKVEKSDTHHVGKHKKKKLFLSVSLSLSCLNHLHQNHQTWEGRTIADHMCPDFSNYD